MADPPPTSIPDAAREPGAGRPRPGSNRGFWLVAGGLLAAGAVVVVGAILTRPSPPSATAAGNLELALRAARVVRETAGTYASADADELGVVEPRLAFVPADASSPGATTVSVLPAAHAWTAAALDSDGTCRWIRVAAAGGSEEVARGRRAELDPCSARSAAPA